MDLPLHEIKEVLEYDDLEKVVEFLDRAEKKADEKLKALQYSKSKIQLAKADYERKLREQQKLKFSGAFLKDLPERIILLSDTLEVPTLDNLWSYLSHFYNKVGPALKDHFSFEDQAGIYSEPGLTRLFAVCTRYPEIEGLKRLPGGRYLCADCTEENRAQILEKLTRTARTKYHTTRHLPYSLLSYREFYSGIMKYRFISGNKPFRSFLLVYKNTWQFNTK